MKVSATFSTAALSLTCPMTLERKMCIRDRSKTKGMAGKLCTYTTDGDYYVLEAQADCVSNSNKTAAADVALSLIHIFSSRIGQRILVRCKSSRPSGSKSATSSQ